MMMNLTPSDPRFLDLTPEQMIVDLALKGYMDHGGDRELWFEDEAAADGDDTPMPLPEYTEEDRQKALERLAELAPGFSVNAGLTSGEFYLEDGVEYVSEDE